MRSSGGEIGCSMVILSPVLLIIGVCMWSLPAMRWTCMLCILYQILKPHFMAKLNERRPIKLNDTRYKFFKQ